MDINLFVSIINFIIFYRLIKVAAKILKVDISITKEIESYYNIYCEKKILKKKRKNMSTLIYFEKHKNFNEYKGFMNEKEYNQTLKNLYQTELIKNKRI